MWGGVETGGTWVVCLLGSGPEDIVAHTRFATATPEATVAAIADFFAHTGQPVPARIGVGAFGPIGVDPDARNWGRLGATPKPGWAHAELGRALVQATQAEVVIDTDVNAAALAESRWGAGRGCGTVAYVTVGTGIGVGTVIDGAPIHGLGHPEAGHMRIPHDRARDPFIGSCPIHGDCWEGLASGTALAARWGRPGGELEPGHPAWALEGDLLALGITNLFCTLSPQRVILGGGVLAGPGLRDRVRTGVAELLGGYLDRAGIPLGAEDMDTLIVAPELGDRAGALGALALVADR